MSAQRVYYCRPVSERYSSRWELAGKAGDFYWVRSTRRSTGRGAENLWSETWHFDIYDSRMSQVNSAQAYPLSDSTIKEYFIAGDDSFDELILQAGATKTFLVVQRHEPKGALVGAGVVVGTFPFKESGNSFLLIRSQDRQRLLLLAFQSISSSSPRLYAILFDKNWNQLSAKLYSSPSISQPFIQDDFAGFPMEDYDKGPVKLANDGEWLMAAPSRNNTNFLLFHFCDTTSEPTTREIPLAPSAIMEDIDLYVDNGKGDAVTGILSTLQYEVLKDVRVARYSMAHKKMEYDSSYRLNTLVSGMIRNENLVKENFVAVPGKGFMLLKEYGRAYLGWEGDSQSDDYWDPNLLLTDNRITEKGIATPTLHDGYARYGILGALGKTHDRGDLGLFYFPAGNEDSCWSGILEKEQETELNAPNLSYMVVPVKDKIFLLYNSYLRDMDFLPGASATVLTPEGYVVPDEGVLFWQFKMPLDFQQSRQISPSEVMVPYADNIRKGFALIRF